NPASGASSRGAPGGRQRPRRCSSKSEIGAPARVKRARSSSVRSTTITRSPERCKVADASSRDPGHAHLLLDRPGAMPTPNAFAAALVYCDAYARATEPRPRPAHAGGERWRRPFRALTEYPPDGRVGIRPGGDDIVGPLSRRRRP